jgi:hypothetical protein
MRMPNLLDEIDFESLKESVSKKHLNSPQEFESQAKQIFSMVLKKYDNMPLLLKVCSGILNTCIGVQMPAQTEQKPMQNKLPGLDSMANKMPPVRQSAPAPAPIPNMSYEPVQTNNFNPAPVVNAPLAFEGSDQLTREEKKVLGQKIRKLNQKYMRGIINIVSNEHELK